MCGGAFKQTGTVKLCSFQPITPLSRNTNIPTTQARCPDCDAVGGTTGSDWTVTCAEVIHLSYKMRTLTVWLRDGNVDLLVCPQLRSRLKYLNKFWKHCNEILSWSPGGKS